MNLRHAIYENGAICISVYKFVQISWHLFLDSLLRASVLRSSISGSCLAFADPTDPWFENLWSHSRVIYKYGKFCFCLLDLFEEIVVILPRKSDVEHSRTQLFFSAPVFVGSRHVSVHLNGCTSLIEGWSWFNFDFIPSVLTILSECQWFCQSQTIKIFLFTKSIWRNGKGTV